ncbi:odorant receptor 10-like isoform X2 [Nomia melanderi]|uniref:odorant receptor 10-like isoform X2 n=1 Tax=Nomia melanderi TaxID=2448451 RepID=UPI003FCDD795
MLFIYGQLEILEYRLQNVPKSKNQSAKECVCHHDCIYRFARNVNKIFQGIVSVQFLSSVGMMCFTLYRMTQVGLGSKAVEMFMYALCMLTQIFYYCYHGDQVKQKSLGIPDLIITTKWTTLDDDTKKILLMIMRRATFSIQFTGTSVVSVNLESFMTVMKTAYSAFNLLQQR